MVVEVTNPENPSKTVITLFEAIQGELKSVAVLKLVKDNLIQLELIENRTRDGNPVSLPLKYYYQPEDGFAPICECMEGRNNRIREKIVSTNGLCYRFRLASHHKGYLP